MLSTGYPRGRTFLSGGGELGALIRAQDWSGCASLGPPEQWPVGLKTATRIMLTSRQAIWIGWGPALISLYNDAAGAIIGGRHPAALGQPTATVWREIWDDISPTLATAMEGDEGTYVEAQRLILERNGYQEETYHTFSYSPIANDDGSVGGIICAHTEETERVVRERQVKLLRQLATGSAEARTIVDACYRVGQALAANPHDLPFALLYLLDTATNQLDLAATTGIAAGLPASPQTIGADRAGPWPGATVLRTRAAEVVALSHIPAGTLPHDPWDCPSREAIVVPLAGRGQRSVVGLLVVGLNPYRLLDDPYREFIELVAAQISTNLANANAYEDESHRADVLAELDRSKTAFFSNASREFRAPLEDLLAQPPGTFSVEHQELLIAVHRNSLHLRERTVQVESVINHAPLGVCLVDRDFKIAQANPIAVSILGDIPNLIGRDFDEVIHRMWTTAYADEIVRRFRHTLLTGECHVIHERAEFRVERGTTDYCDWRIDRIPLPDRRHGVVCYFRDGSDVRLPLREIGTNESTVSGRKLSNLAASFVGTRALVVDEEPAARDLLRHVLETQGAKVTAVGSAGAAIYTFARQRFDVLIADIGMPERDGFSLIRSIRGLPESRGGGVPAIAVTAYASRRDREQAFAAGYDYHLSKPVERQQLVATVANAVIVADAIDSRGDGGDGSLPIQPRPKRRPRSNLRKP